MKKGFEADISFNNTPIFKEDADKPLRSEDNRPKKVDINVLKARAQEATNKENKKNISIFIFFLIVMVIAGIYLTI